MPPPPPLYSHLSNLHLTWTSTIAFQELYFGILNNSAKDIHVLIPRTCECCLMYQKRLCRYYWIKDLKMGRVPWNLGFLQEIFLQEGSKKVKERSRRQWKQQLGTDGCKDTTGQRMLVAPWYQPRDTDFELLVSRTVRELTLFFSDAKLGQFLQWQ